MDNMPTVHTAKVLISVRATIHFRDPAAIGGRCLLEPGANCFHLQNHNIAVPVLTKKKKKKDLPVKYRETNVTA